MSTFPPTPGEVGMLPTLAVEAVAVTIAAVTEEGDLAMGLVVDGHAMSGLEVEQLVVLFHPRHLRAVLDGLNTTARRYFPATIGADITPQMFTEQSGEQP